MTAFPSHAYLDAGNYFADYAVAVADALASVDRVSVQAAAAMLDTAYRAGATVYVCGNGGSAAIANHFLCDHTKGVQTHTPLLPRVVSLCSNLELLTAIANDLDYAEAFVYPLRSLAQPGDVLVTVSSSGNSENVVRAATFAQDRGLHVLALTGFSGGRTGSLASVHVHVRAHNYGIVEDCHQAIMHSLAQYLRQRHMAVPKIASTTF